MFFLETSQEILERNLEPFSKNQLNSKDRWAWIFQVFPFKQLPVFFLPSDHVVMRMREQTGAVHRHRGAEGKFHLHQRLWDLRLRSAGRVSRWVEQTANVFSQMDKKNI